jgi:hypothetical protein
VIPLCVLVLTLTGAAVAQADVRLVEQIVNPGFGPDKVGARTTTNRVFLKERRQKVETTIETTERTARALREQGQSLRESTILRLDRDEVIEIDLDAATYSQAKVPAAKAVTAPAAPRSGAPQIGFQVRETGDTTRVAGIPCRRVVAQMRARYLDPKTKKPQRENRYTYDAWIARDFPGSRELTAFRDLQRSRTSYPPLISGGLEQLRGIVEDYDSLASEMSALEGYALRSTMRVTVVRAGQTQEAEVFRLEREVKELVYSALPDSVFEVPRALTRVSDR